MRFRLLKKTDSVQCRQTIVLLEDAKNKTCMFFVYIIQHESLSSSMFDGFFMHLSRLTNEMLTTKKNRDLTNTIHAS